MLLLDTNVVSELRKVKSGKAHPNVIAWDETVDPAETFICAIVLHELEIGVRLSEHNNPAAGKILREWLNNTVTTTFAGRILPLDETAAVQAAHWHVPDPQPVNDAYIAAIAHVRHMTLVTRNVKDFGYKGLSVINPWEFSATVPGSNDL